MSLGANRGFQGGRSTPPGRVALATAVVDSGSCTFDAASAPGVPDCPFCEICGELVTFLYKYKHIGFFSYLQAALEPNYHQ